MGRRSHAGAALSQTQIRDIANILAGMALFWTYLFWSQFLVIWYGNVTAEVGYLTPRIGVSRAAGWIVLTLCGAAPAVVFVAQWGKQMATLRVMTAFILSGLWLEQWILVAPGVPANSSMLTPPTITALFAAAFMLSIRPVHATSAP